MQVSHRELSHWVMLVSLLVIYGIYFYKVLPAQGNDIAGTDIGLLAITILASIIVPIVGQIIIALISTPEAEDERDRLIALSGARVSRFVLAGGVVVAIVLALRLEGNFWLIQVLLGSLVISEVAQFAVQLYRHHWG